MCKVICDCLEHDLLLASLIGAVAALITGSGGSDGGDNGSSGNSTLQLRLQFDEHRCGS